MQEGIDKRKSMVALGFIASVALGFEVLSGSASRETLEEGQCLPSPFYSESSAFLHRIDHEAMHE